MNKNNMLEIMGKALKSSSADQTEILCISSENALVRFANNAVHQNNFEKSLYLSVRAIKGKKIGSSGCNMIDEESLNNTIKKACEYADIQKEDKNFVSLPKPAPIKKVNVYDEEASNCTPELMADYINSIVGVAKKNNLESSGTFSVNSGEISVVNSLGVKASNKSTGLDLLTTFDNGGGTGYGMEESWKLSDIDPKRVADKALKTCLMNKNQAEIEPGDYEVVLEEEAVATLIGFLAYMGFGASSFQEKRSFMSGNIGKRIADEKITIYDDGLDEKGRPMPFDFEGVGKQKVMLIEKGIAKSVVYDSYTANKENKNSTGHGLPSPNPYGPMPMSLFVEKGKHTKEEMISSVKKGLLVKKFHYTNVVHPIKTIITGMTRDGLFLIENGKITKAVKNLRFTDSVLNVLNFVEMISKERKFVSSYVVPAMKVKYFKFTGKTEF